MYNFYNIDPPDYLNTIPDQKPILCWKDLASLSSLGLKLNQLPPTSPGPEITTCAVILSLQNYEQITCAHTASQLYVYSYGGLDTQLPYVSAVMLTYVYMYTMSVTSSNQDYS